MENEFVSYTQALALKELGFNEPCLSLYLDNHKKTMTSSMKGADTNSWLKEHYSGYGNSITAPLKQQAFRWFREKHNLHPSIMYNGIGQYDFTLKGDWSGRIWDTYEEAEQACLDKLIEIVKIK